MQEKILQNTIVFLDFLNKFRDTDRKVYATGTDRMETDVEHSYQLAMVAWFLISKEKLNLDLNKVIKYALVHDLVEAYAGDTPFMSDACDTKCMREQDALKKISKNFGEDFESLHKTIEVYENRLDDESKFIHALDKLLPVINGYMDDGKSWKKLRKDIDMDAAIEIKRVDVSQHEVTARLLEEVWGDMMLNKEKYFCNDNLKQRLVAENLILFKKPFGHDNEKEILVSFLRDNFNSETINWLDVGIGDGSFAKKVVKKLRLDGNVVNVTGIDPELSESTRLNCEDMEFTLIEEGVEDFVFSGSGFNFINMRQSAYYMKDPVMEIVNIAKETKPGTIFAITNWSEDCTLYALHKFICDKLNIPDTITNIERLVAGLKNELSSAEISIEFVESTVDTSVLLSEPNVARAVFDVVSRGIGENIDVSEKIKLVRSFVSTHNTKSALRKNGIIFIKI